MSKEPPRIFLLCVIHSKKGQLIAGTVRQFGNDLAACCPFCLHSARPQVPIGDGSATLIAPPPEPETANISDTQPPPRTEDLLVSKGAVADGK